MNVTWRTGQLDEWMRAFGGVRLAFGAVQLFVESGQADAWTRAGRLADRSVRRMAEEGHLSDRGKTDEWTRVGRLADRSVRRMGGGRPLGGSGQTDAWTRSGNKSV